MVTRRTALQSFATLLSGVSAGCVGLINNRIQWQKRIAGIPLLDRDTLYVYDRLTLYALSPTDGSRRWTISYDEDEFDDEFCLSVNLAVDDKRIFVSACDGLRAYRRSDGEQVWFVDSPLRAGVTAEGGRVYVNGEDFLAIDAESGDVDWRASVGGERMIRPAATEEEVIFTNRIDGAVTVFDPDGEHRWTYRTESETRSPTISDGIVYVATAPDPGREGRLLALDLQDGTVQWKVNTPSSKRGTRPVVGAEAVYLGCTGRDYGSLVVRSREDGSKRWTFTDENSSVYEPALADGVVYAGSNDNNLYAFSRSGTRRWTIETNSTVGFVVPGSEFVYASNSERLFAAKTA